MPHVGNKSKMPPVDKKCIKGAQHAYLSVIIWSHSLTQGIS